MPLRDWDALIENEMPAQIDEAVAVERFRCAGVLTAAVEEAMKRGAGPLADTLAGCRDVIEVAKPEPPAPEPTNEDMRTPRYDDVKAWHKIMANAVAEAVEAERAKCVAMAEEWGISSVCEQDTAAHRRCRNLARVMGSGLDLGQVPVPPPEPLTVEKVLERLRARECVMSNLDDWTYTKLDLQLLIKAQAARDAEIARYSKYSGDILAGEIRRAAGLE